MPASICSSIGVVRATGAPRRRRGERVHAAIPADLDGALRVAGVHACIWRSGRDLFHLVEVDDYRAVRAALRDDPVNVAWQARMAPRLEVADDYSGGDEGLPLVWELP